LLAQRSTLVDRIVVPAVAATHLRDGEGRRGAHAQLEDFFFEAGLVRQLETQDRDAAIGDRIAEFYDVSLRVRARGPLQRENLIIGGGERLGAQRRDSGSGRNSIVSSARAPLRRRRGKGKRNLREFGYGSAPSRRCGTWRGQKREKAGFGAPD